MLTILYCALLLSAWISCPLANIDVRQCPSRFQRTEGICIAIEPSKGYTFEEAQSACASKGNNAHLLKIGKESVFNYLKNNVVNNGNDVWLGAVLKNDGGFEWLDSTKCCDPYWLPGEPNNNGGAPNCVNIYRPGNNAGLNDDHCSERKGFVCEIKECTVISNCETPNCTWYGDTKCSKCYDDNIFFKKTTNDTLCERLCDHDSHLCWPGTCRSGLKKNCVCAPQFDLNTNVTSTLCQLNKNQTATIETCATTVYSEKGDAFQSRGNSSSTECQFRGNFFGNIQPRRLVYTFVSSFKVNLTAFGTIPPYIQETRFGTLTIIKKDLGGSETTLLAEHILIDNNQSQNAKELFTKNDNISIPNTTLVDGQMLCVVYEANSGGYLKSKNMFTSQHIISAAKPYRKRTSSKRICYKYDAGKPKHCAELMNCRMEPLQLAERITKNPLINVSFNGWTDPFPSGGNQSHASGIESFEVYVHEVVPPNGTLSSIVFSKKVNNAESSISLNFTSDLPKLYCITLETKDFANNVQRARRFVLYDNFSSLNTSYKNLFQITSASSAEPYAWQNHHSDVCLDWKGYFYNTFFRDNELLNSIQPDRLIEVDSIYDQTEGVLPVSGTPNIAGILGFVFHWTRHRQFHENTTGSDIVPNFENQQFCKALDMEDGDTFYMQIEALDVVNNSLGSNRTLFIDRTAPQIVNINLLKNGVTQLFVYDSTDLSGMILFFKTYDSHSGIRNMKWSFGKSDTREELLNGTLGAKYVNESYNCTSGADACYCPMIGKCEHFNYTVDLNKLHILGTHMGNHNRNYYFTLTATNNAGLSNTESIDILVDDSPPEPGVVFEGVGSNEPFYLLLKSVNKANLQSTTTIGPFIIDNTPPEYNTIPSVEIDDKFINISWSNDTFYDDEQRSPIQTIFFQFGHDDVTVTPLLEWTLDQSKKCVHGDFCFSIPLSKLQYAETEQGVFFYANVYLYNIVGHSRELQSSLFQLPSMYPPGKGHVIDIDPNVIDIFNKEDVAIHFTPHKLCAHWHGFHHHENISYTIGIGSKISSADIVGFVASANTSFACIYSEKILPDTLYYFHVKASCSGGTISSISNGVVIIDYSLQIYDIQHGLRNSPCHALNYVTTYTNGQSQICLVSSVSIGRSYTVHLHNTDITSTAFRIPGKLLVIDRINNETRASFITYVENPCLTIMYSPTPVSVLAFEPNSNDSYINGHDRVCLRYSFPDIMKNIEGYVQYSIIERTCYGISNTTCIESTRPFQILTNNTVNELQKNYQYRSAIRICNQHRCSSTKESRSVDVDFDIPFGEIYLAQIEEYTAVKGYKLTAQWKQFHATSGIALYKWFVSDDMGCLKQITNLSTVSMDKHNLEIINITVTVELPVNKFRSLFYCVRAYSNVGRMYTASKSFALTTAPITDSVYDFDCMRNSWIQIEKLLESYNLGSRFSFLRDEEVTFGQSNSTMVGAIFYNNARLIKWYLMKERRLPLSDCALDISCVATETNKNSYVHFSKDVIFENTYYYICVKTERINVTLEHSVEYLQPIRACSNGFVVDTIPPSDGFVNVTSSSGYITGNEVEISWHGFKDNVDAKLFGYPSYIQFYAYQVGTRRGSGDIQPFREAGRNERLTYELNDLFLDGMALYFTVKAFDYSGLSSSSMSEEVIIDRSPPSVGRVVIERDDRSIVYVTSDFFTANVHGFEDIHSGIKNFEISIGSKSDIENIAQKIVFRNEIVNIDGTGLFIDGHVYFLFAKAVNRAGLQSVAAVATFVVDRTPPEGGYVLDGHWNQSIDLDFQINMHQIVCHWTGFIDIESGISHFIVGLGSNPGEDDIEPMLHVGLQNDYSWNSSFSAGQIYFCSVTVCNKAGLCLSKSSDGILLDNSPPIAGVVRVGLFEKHLHFQSQSTNAHIFWAGFEDPQSGIHHFELCLGTVIELCDLVPYFDTLLHSNIIKTGIDLPINRRLYASVIAFNRVGLNATRSSDYFIIDTTKPIVRMAPSFLHGNTMKLQNTSAVSFEKSKLHVVWKFEDRESTIIQHILTLKTHNEGHTPLDNIKLGQYDSFAITFDKNNWLHNGDRYWVVVTCCNAAGLCTSANSSDILIDSTPPHTGGFLPTMSWNNLGTSGDALSNVSLSWYGFLDQESGIEKYYISASSSFSGQELTKGVLTFRPNTNTHERINFLSDKYIYPNDKLILTIWAQNFAGLNSSAAKVTTIATSETPTKNISDQRGFLSIEKHSCDIHYCDSTCTCSLFNKPCTDAVNYKCVSNNSIDTNIHVSFISENGIIDSSACLAVQWNFTDINPKPFIKRFEWSVGETDSAIGYGIFDLKLEKPWFDVGLNTRGVYCLPTGKNLDPGKHYTAYVKAWFESDMYKIYSSTPIIVDQTAPSVKKLHFVKDSTSDCAKDLDYIDWTDKITACWHDVFQEPQGHIKGYYVSLGTVINGSDVFNNTYVGLYQNLTFSDLDLHSGTRYYITVTAINNIHRRKTAHSDGFVVDTDNPLEGIVFNTKHHVDEHFQSNGDTFSLSWHGFIDHSSGVKAYHVAVIDVDAMQTHVNFINVALKTTHTFQNATLSHGHKYTGLVKAEDAAGHFSKIVHSTPKHIDFSPPIGYTCAQYRPLNNKLLTVSQYTTTEFSSTFLKHVPYAIRGLVSNDNTEVAVRIGRLNSPLALVKNHNGTYAFKYAFTLPMEMKTNIYLEFDIKRETNISVGVYECMDMGEATHGVVTVSQVRKSMFIVSVNVFDPDSGIKKITLGAGTSPGSLQLRSWNVAHCVNDEIMDLQVQHGTPVHVTAIVENYAGHKSVFNSTAVVTDITPPEISNVIFNIETYINISGNTSTISSTITGQWNVIDNETDIKQCSVGIGRSSYGSPNIVPYTYVNDTMVTFHLNSNAHGDVLYGVVKCVNNVELTTLAASGALIVAYEKPNIDLAQVQFIAEAIAAVPFSDLPNKFHTISYSNRSSSNEKIFVQNNLTALKVEWDGIADAAGLNNYEYRVMTSEGVTVNWTDCGNYTFVDITGLNLKPEAIYAIQIRATNLAHATSDDIQTYTFPKGSAPQLTGNDARITLSHNNITLDWSDVFEEHFLISPMNTYDVVVGTRAGNNDVIDLSKKKETTIQFLKPKSSLANSIPTEIFVVIICWDANGQFGVYQTRLQLDRK
ncbi:uncharacterized protein LOC127847524 isoform X3 [Dreissena polymorpha]|uniref:uncharacterized protein LOC127847524 isoform X3 n=1 Tax=Dreissena polymorpha TaxID=45954 RepID=UPI002263EA48|nr:uncharacterized protein LOC127847524 isoform X3 [Dreissena polymorpha]